MLVPEIGGCSTLVQDGINMLLNAVTLYVVAHTLKLRNNVERRTENGR